LEMMNHEFHLSENELGKLLDDISLEDGEQEEFVLSEAATHLKSCSKCRRELELLAAKPDSWAKAVRILKSSKHLDNQTQFNSEARCGKPEGGRGDAWPDAGQDILLQLLDPPRHPEMLGRIGDYDLECEVGRGGMGVVFKAYDSKLHRSLAIKTLAAHLSGNGTARKRFAQEAIAAAGVIHPNVIAVHGVNDEGRIPFIVMPFVDGVSLQTLVENLGPLDEINIVRIALQISAGLAAAHSQGLVHRDIKPANILVEAEVNRVLITDFGLARAVDDASMTQTGWLTGTPNYMSPEQTRGQRPGQSSDLFSLGSTLYFLATGRMPFRSDTPLGVLDRIQTDWPTPLRQVNVRISKTFNDVIDRLLAKEPEHRFQSAAELHEVLEKLLAHLHQPDLSPPPQVKITSRTVGKLTLTKKRVKKILKLGLLSALLFFVAGNLMFWSYVAGWTGKNLNVNFSDNTNAPFDNLDYTNRESDGELLIDNATNFLSMKRYDEAIELYKEATKYPEQAGLAHYNLGCVWALNGDSEKAFDSLSRAIDNGFEQEKLFRTDDDLNSLRTDPRFRDLLQRLK